MFLKITSIALALSLWASVASAAGVYACYKRGFAGPCKRFTRTGSGCVNVDRQLNDHVYSARALDGYCKQYEHANCKGNMWNILDEEGYWALPKGHLTSSFYCGPNL